ncbi:3'-5' exoribonuclease 1-like isoform X2 [Punica granatum]|nr:3'-5' exoribonuclease 1-like isoform X2 [Punica granatum]OWM69130.1 hypothetical protein CDL15_Pgr025317 [Punica granatum]PKI57780.1 hypothetical protein CRG98_021847 [Punica granatum]
MQKYCEASVGCLQSNLLPHNLQYRGGNYLQGFFEAKDDTAAHLGGGSAAPNGKISRMSSVPPFEAYRRPVHQHEVEVRAAFYPELQKAQQNHLYAFEAHYYPFNYEYGFPIENRFQYMPFKVASSPQSYQQETNHLQEFQYFVVIDFEATCDRDRNPHPQEIIEFPSVLVNSSTGQLEDCFQIYVRPTYNQHLSDFCKELTGIQQNQVEKGVLLSDALLMHDKWLEEKGIKQTNFAVVTWSNWDCRVMLESECRFKKIRKPPYFNRWINLKVPFHEVFGGVRCNLKEAVQLAGLVWEGRAHCGLDDAKNTAHLLAHLMQRGFKFTITNSLVCASPEFHPTARPPQQSPKLAAQHPFMPSLHFLPIQTDPPKEREIYCYCGVKSSKRVVRKPGPKHGSSFFGCGKWTTARGAVCHYFEWATP